jgi:hypothetical protein
LGSGSGSGSEPGRFGELRLLLHLVGQAERGLLRVRVRVRDRAGAREG